MIKFIFDLDGTLTKKESLPLIAKHFGIEADMERLTMQTVQGKLNFEESFTKRVKILENIAADKVSSFLENMEIYPSLEKFIQENQSDCLIATSNLDVWIEKLVKRFSCETRSSLASVLTSVEKNRIVKISSLLQKDMLVQEFQEKGYYVVFIGDGQNDYTAMQRADLSIAVGLTHMPSPQLIEVSDFVFYDEIELYQKLIKIHKDYKSKALV